MPSSDSSSDSTDDAPERSPTPQRRPLRRRRRRSTPPVTIESDDDVPHPPTRIPLASAEHGRRSTVQPQISTRAHGWLEKHHSKPSIVVTIEDLEKEMDLYRESPQALVRRLNEKRKLNLDKARMEQSDPGLTVSNSYSMDALCIESDLNRGLDAFMPQDVGQRNLHIDTDFKHATKPLGEKHFPFGYSLIGRTMCIGNYDDLNLHIVWEPNRPDIQSPEARTTTLPLPEFYQFLVFWAWCISQAGKGKVVCKNRDAVVSTREELDAVTNILYVAVSRAFVGLALTSSLSHSLCLCYMRCCDSRETRFLTFAAILSPHHLTAKLAFRISRLSSSDAEDFRMLPADLREVTLRLKTFVDGWSSYIAGQKGGTQFFIQHSLRVFGSKYGQDDPCLRPDGDHEREAETFSNRFNWDAISRIGYAGTHTVRYVVCFQPSTTTSCLMSSVEPSIPTSSPSIRTFSASACFSTLRVPPSTKVATADGFTYSTTRPTHFWSTFHFATCPPTSTTAPTPFFQSLFPSTTTWVMNAQSSST